MSKYLLALNSHPKIGSQTIKKMLAAFCDDAEKLWKSDGRELKKIYGEKFQDMFMEAKNQFDPDEEVKKLRKLGIGYLTFFDKRYPDILREIYDAPIILYIKGDINAFNVPAISIVGSRKFSSYGQNVAYRLSKECAENGLGIISGLALGIDAVAHKGALDADGITIGVLGCGLDRIYPVANQGLAYEIIKKGGAIVSEYPPGTEAFKQNFPARNRIIAGLSKGILVVEAAEISGALITAEAGLEYDREIFAVPGPITSETSRGCNLLIQKGAKLVQSIDDILGELNIEKIKFVDKIKEISPANDKELSILEIIGSEDMPADLILVSSKINVIELNSLLTIMEMKGLIENVGGRYRKKI
ncbi:MAG: DNA-processing protein DprA [Patescibacteria group bacterium]|jgi:DNA processing protein